MLCDLTEEKVKAYLHYDPGAGVFTWKESLPNNRVAGQRAGYTNKRGYVRIRVESNLYCAHRLVWLYVYGQWPAAEIDHINGNPSDNRLCNLRSVTHRGNCQNRVSHRQGRLPGTKYDRRRQKAWSARIVIKGKARYLGAFFTEQEAHEAYVNACKEYNNDMS